MQFSHFKVYEKEPAGEEKEAYLWLGYVCELMSRCHGHRMMTLGTLNRILKPAIAHRQIKVFFNDERKVVGYVVWAMLAPDVEDRFINKQEYDLHYSEWDEGDSLWVLDFSAPDGHMKYILAYLRDSLFFNAAAIRYFRIKHGKLFIKEMQRNERFSFFKKSSV